MNENIKEKISAMVDGELSEFEVRRVLDEIGKNKEYLNYWNLLQLTRSSIANQPLGKIQSDLSTRVEKELNKNVPSLDKKHLSKESKKGYIGAAVAASLFLVFSVNYLSNANTSEVPFSLEASQKIANAISSPEAMKVLSNAVIGTEATLENFNYDARGSIMANYRFPSDGKTFKVSLAPVNSPTYSNFQKRNLNRVYIRTNNGVFAFSITGNITDDKKSKILQNANYFSDESK